MPLQLSPDHVTRLALARYLLQHARTLKENRTPLNSLALLSMHDAIEMVLDVLAETANVAIPTGANFNAYWTVFNASSVHLPLERQMKRLNAARVALKHHGQRPSGDQLVAHLDNATAFIEDVCDKNFGMALSELSMVELIKNDKVRTLIKEAQEAIARNDLPEAFTKAALGLAYGSRDAYQALGAPRQELRFSVHREAERWIRPVFEKIENAFRQIGNRYDLTISLVALGIDLRSYNRFQGLTPDISISAADVAYHVWKTVSSDSKEDANWCVDFVTDFMLRAEGFPGYR
jgi:hypothetical protein